MKRSFPFVATCMVVVASVLVWVIGVSMALTYFFELSPAAGWWIAGSLGFSSMVAITVIFHEMRYAVEVDSVGGWTGLEDLEPIMPWNIPVMSPKRCPEA